MTKDSHTIDYNFNITKGLSSTLKSIFNLSNNDSDFFNNCFKVLVFDDYVFEILSPLLKLFSLREENIALHMNIKANKERISDVMSIYLIQPTKENFDIIKSDIDNNMFDNYYFAFVDYCTKDIIHEFFSLLIETGKYNKVYKIESHPIGILSFHPKVFSINFNYSKTSKPSFPYFLLNYNKVKDDQINLYISKVSSGIFYSMFCLNTLPIVKFRQGWFAESIIKEIQNIIDYLFDKFPEIKEKLNNVNNTLLVLMDRETDLPIMFHHGGSLGSLVHDLFGITRSKNNCHISDKKNNTNALEIDPIDDFIWNTFCSDEYFEKVEPEIKREFSKIAEETKFLDDTSNSNIANIANSNSKSALDLMKISEKMYSTIDNIKDIQLKKNILNNYAMYNSEIHKLITERDLGMFYDLEYKMFTQRKAVVNGNFKKNLIDILESSVKGLINNNNKEKKKIDILRCACIYYLLNVKIQNSEVSQIEKILESHDINIAPFKFLKSKREFSESMSFNSNNNNASNSIFSKGFSFIKDRLEGILQDGQVSIIADIAYNLSNGKEINNYYEYNFLKKEKTSLSSNNNNNRNNIFNKLIVFVCGGGNFVEYEYLDSYMKQKGKTVSFY